jgi:hypothetical protein
MTVLKVLGGPTQRVVAQALLSKKNQSMDLLHIVKILALLLDATRQNILFLDSPPGRYFFFRTQQKLLR